MASAELNSLGEEVRKQGNPEAGRSMKDLVFDPETGEFKQVASSGAASEGDVVTGMTKDGFASGRDGCI